MAYWIRRKAEAKFFSPSPAVGGVAVGDRVVGIGVRFVHGHAVIRHATTTAGRMPGSAGRGHRSWRQMGQITI